MQSCISDNYFETEEVPFLEEFVMISQLYLEFKPRTVVPLIILKLTFLFFCLSMVRLWPLVGTLQY